MDTLSACGSAEGTDNLLGTETSAMHAIPLSAASSVLTGVPENVPDGALTAVSQRSFDFDTKTVTLNSGYQMPIYGLGTYSLHDEECVNSVAVALNSGVRLIDTAHAYGNEKEIGQAIRDSGIPREEIFVITKLYPDQFSDPEAAIDEAMKKLDIGYIDMMLLHHPGTGDVAAYKAMEQAVADGRIRSIGLSKMEYGFKCA